MRKPHVWEIVIELTDSVEGNEEYCLKRELKAMYEGFASNFDGDLKDRVKSIRRIK